MAVLMFPGQGSQVPGMGKEIYDARDDAKKWFDQADEILGFDLSKTMFEGSEDDLKQTKITQPAVFLNSYVRYAIDKDNFTVNGVGGHSLGEFTALCANGVLSFEDAISLVFKRALAMQDACDNTEGTMAAILGLDDAVVEKLCEEVNGVVVAANYNCPGQLVISGDIPGINEAVAKAQEAGARRALVLNVNGAFHSPLMASAKETLAEAIHGTHFNDATVPVYQNVNGLPEMAADKIKQNLIDQLTSSVRWTQTMKNMIADGHTEYVEFGAKVLSGFFKRVDRRLNITQV